MWKKDEEQGTQPTVDTPSRVASPRPPAQTSGRATIGPSISIRGDVTGSEDLLIQGKIDGSVTLNDHSVGVGSEGRVTADIVGRLITVEGHVEGDLTAQEQIVLRGSARVKGDIKAPRVVLEDGATFRGLVDMGSPAKADEDRSRSSSAPDAKSSTSSTSGSGNGSADGSTSKSTAQSKSATGASGGSRGASGSSSGSSGSDGGSSGSPSGASGSSSKGKEASKSADSAGA